MIVICCGGIESYDDDIDGALVYVVVVARVSDTQIDSYQVIIIECSYMPEISTLLNIDMRFDM